VYYISHTKRLRFITNPKIQITKYKIMKNKVQKMDSADMVDSDNADEEVSLVLDQAPEETEIMVTGNEDMEGDFDSSDIDFPKLQVAQAVGPLADDWKKGDIVIDGTLKIGDLKNPLELTCVTTKKLYVEDLPYGGDEIPRTFKTKDEVFNAGGTITWADGPPTYKAIMDVLVCVKHPGKRWEQTGETKGEGKWVDEEPCEDSFPFDHKYGKNVDYYLFAEWRIKGASYKTAAKNITKAAKFYYRKKLTQGTFFLTTQLKSRNDGGSYVIANMDKGVANDVELQTWLKEFTAN
jgi:hypothetical protein